jgi:hypothetical protein
LTIDENVASKKLEQAKRLRQIVGSNEAKRRKSSLLK